MKLVLAALSRQLRIEKARLEQRQLMLTNGNEIFFDGQILPPDNSTYIAELQEAIALLEENQQKPSLEERAG